MKSANNFNYFHNGKHQQRSEKSAYVCLHLQEHVSLMDDLLICLILIANHLEIKRRCRWFNKREFFLSSSFFAKEDIRRDDLVA